MNRKEASPEAIGARRLLGLTPALACAAFLLFSASAPEPWADAHAAAPTTGGIPNPADDRARMQAELARISATLEAIRASLERGAVKVEVVKMPAERAAR